PTSRTAASSAVPAGRSHRTTSRCPSSRRSTSVRTRHYSCASSRRSTQSLTIAEHGVIGDLRTVALVGTDGTIDWYCCPRFDSPSIFGAILDRHRGGYFRIAPTMRDGVVKQLYFPDTNVLITRFLTPQGVGEVQDFMPVAPPAS